MKHKTIFVIALLCLTITLVWLNSARANLLLANTLARLDNYQVSRDIAYGEYDDTVMDIYTPPDAINASERKPVVIFFYGGCWGACMAYKKSDYTFVAQAFTALGYIVVIPDYRHYPEFLFNDIMTDAAAVTTWVAKNIAEYDGDGTRIVLAGHSAGAHMAAMLTLDESWLAAADRARISGFIGLAGAYDFLPFSEDYQATLFGPEQNYPKSQPVNFVDGNEAPMLLLYGNDDTRVKPVNIESLTSIAIQAGSEIEAHRYDGLDHASILAALSRPRRDKTPVMADIVRFIDSVTNCN